MDYMPNWKPKRNWIQNQRKSGWITIIKKACGQENKGKRETQGCIFFGDKKRCQRGREKRRNMHFYICAPIGKVKKQGKQETYLERRKAQVHMGVDRVVKAYSFHNFYSTSNSLRDTKSPRGTCHLAKTHGPWLMWLLRWHLVVEHSNFRFKSSQIHQNSPDAHYNYWKPMAHDCCDCRASTW